MTPPDLTRLSPEEKDALILALFAQLAAAHEKTAALEARPGELTRPPKTPDNSSKPPSQAQKRNQPDGKTRPPRASRPGAGRVLHPNPDRVVDARLAACPGCEAAFPETSQTAQRVCERIGLPPVRPDVTQARLFGGRCACCGERITAQAPAGLEPDSPFGASIAAMAVYLRYSHATGMERLALLMEELFGLSISEGAVSNILARAREPLLDATAAIGKAVLASPATAAACHGHRKAAGQAEGHDPEAISARPGPPARQDHGCGPGRGTRAEAAQAHARQPGASVRVHDQPRRAVYGQRLGAPSPARRDLPEGDEWVPPRAGSGGPCRVPFRVQHRQGEWRFGP